MSRIAASGFRTSVVIVPIADWDVFGALPTEYSFSMRKDGNPLAATDTNGVQIDVPPNIGDLVKWLLTDDGQFDASGTIISLSWPVYYESIASPLSTDSCEIEGIIGAGNTSFGLATWGANGAITFTNRSNTTNPITGLAWTRADIFGNSFGFRVASINGSPDVGATVKFYQGIPRISYFPIALIANVTSLPDGTAGQSITIKGDNFNGQSVNCRVQVGPSLQDCTNIVVVDINTITCDIPDLTLYNGTIITVFVTFNTVPPTDEENIWSQNTLLLTDPDGLDLGGITPPPPIADIEITGSGGFEMGSNIATPIVLSADISGIYTLVLNQHFDRVYTRNSDADDTTDVAIPTPFGKSAFLGN